MSAIGSRSYKMTLKFSYLNAIRKKSERASRSNRTMLIFDDHKAKGWERFSAKEAFKAYRLVLETERR